MAHASRGIRTEHRATGTKNVSRYTATTVNVHPSLELDRRVNTAIAMNIVKAIFASRASASNWPIWETCAARTQNVIRDTALTHSWAGDGGGAREMEMESRASIAITTTIAQAANAIADVAGGPGFVLIGKVGVGVLSKELASDDSMFY